MEDQYREDVFSKSIRAGKRTYFFDVKTTKGNDLYLTITESKKRIEGEGQFSFEKHKIFLYKEDFGKFTEGLDEAIAKISELKATGNFPDDGPMDRQRKRDEEGASVGDVNFDDLS
ncbi:MAG: DUF3276 family protein [Flavobacteriales bacterium]|nr:DUF3276 family protein [Flavobacteriales bacterium]